MHVFLRLLARGTVGFLVCAVGLVGTVQAAHAQALGTQVTGTVRAILSELHVDTRSATKRVSRTPESVPGELLVKFKGSKTFERRSATPFSSVSDAVRAYRGRGDVEYAEPNYIAHALALPNDPFYPYQWNFDNGVNGGIHMNDVWGVEDGGGVVVAVVDTGVAYENYGSYSQAPDLAQTSFAPGWDFVNNDAHPNDDQGHGTHVTGTVAQSTNNAVGVAGVASGVTIMPVKVLSSSGSGSYANVANGVVWAADNGAQVINLSLGGSYSSQALASAVAYAHNKGVLVVAAAGNNGQGALSYPAAYTQDVVSVGATRFDETRAPYSNYGNGLSLVAPGGDIKVDQNGDGYGDGILQQTFNKNTGVFGYYFYQGTSMAAPHVAGVAALIIGKGLATTADEVRTVLEGSADDLGAPGYDTTYGHGLLNAAQALAYTAPPAEEDPPVDVCPNVPGDQSSGPCADQECVDQGGTWNGSSCDLPPPPPPAEEPPALTMHVSSIEFSVRKVSRDRFCKVEATVTVVDKDGGAVASAAVNGSWSGKVKESESGTTSGSGAVLFETDRWTRCGTYTFTVDSIAKDGWEYVPGDNTETSDSITP